MKSWSSRSKTAIRFRRTALLAVLSVVTMASLPASSNPAANDARIHLVPWSPTFQSESERNIEKYAISQIQPPYPVAAQRYRIQGTVTVQVAVNKDGKVLKAGFVRGHTVFKSVSIEAAKQWQFEFPNSTDTEGTIDFIFKLK